MGFAFVLAGALGWLGQRHPRGWAAVAGIIVVLYATRTLCRWPDWRDDRALNQATAAEFQETPTPLLNLAEIEAAAGDRAAALRYLSEAERRAPGWPGIRKVAERILSTSRAR